MPGTIVAIPTQGKVEVKLTVDRKSTYLYHYNHGRQDTYDLRLIVPVANCRLLVDHVGRSRAVS